MAHRIDDALNDRAVADELGDLLRLVQTGRLPVHIGWRGPLERFADAAQALRNRQVNGKAILDVVRE